MKNLQLICLACALSLTFAGCGQTNNPIQPTQNTTINQPANLYTDEKTGISFLVADGWKVDKTDENDLRTYRTNPNLKITFKVYTDKATWEQRIKNEPISQQYHADKDDKKDTTTVGGFPTTRLFFQRYVGQSKSFRFGYNFVDAGSKWYEIQTSDPESKEIQDIINSIKF